MLGGTLIAANPPSHRTGRLTNRVPLSQKQCWGYLYWSRGRRLGTEVPGPLTRLFAAVGMRLDDGRLVERDRGTEELFGVGGETGAKRR